jgi:hypothetical protein
MKHYLPIWSLMMLLIHLSVLTLISFGPGERVGVSIKKVCLRKEAQARIMAAGHTTSLVQHLVKQAPDAENGQEDGLIETHCFVQLLSTAPHEQYVLFPLVLEVQKPGYKPSAYFCLSKFLEPDPPRLA